MSEELIVVSLGTGLLECEKWTILMYMHPS